MAKLNSGTRIYGNATVDTNVGIGNASTAVYDAVGAVRPLSVQKSDTNTTLNGSLASITITNGDTTTSNTAQLNFAAITGASTNQYSSAIISTIFGARTNGQYPTGQLVFSTSTSLNTAPSEKMRIDSSVISDKPAYLMNSEAIGSPVALMGRVPCLVTGNITKGDRLVSSYKPGHAMKMNPDLYEPGCIIGKALENFTGESGTIEILIGKT